MLFAKTSRRNQLTILFAAATLVLLIIATVGTANYYQFYPAISQIQASITSLQTSLVPDNMGGYALEVRVAFSTGNPTSYNGLFMKHFESTYDVMAIFSPTSNETFTGGAMTYNAASGLLNPGNTVSIVYPSFNATGDASQAASNPQTKMEFIFHIDFVLSSFLDKVTMVIPSYDCTGSSGSSECVQTGITIVTTPGGSGGGGGGGGGV